MATHKRICRALPCNSSPAIRASEHPFPKGDPAIPHCKQTRFSIVSLPNPFPLSLSVHSRARKPSPRSPASEIRIPKDRAPECCLLTSPLSLLASRLVREHTRLPLAMFPPQNVPLKAPFRKATSMMAESPKTASLKPATPKAMIMNVSGPRCPYILKTPLCPDHRGFRQGTCAEAPSAV